MPYSPPVGTANLALTGSYSPPTGTANLALGGGDSDDRTLTLAGDALAPTGRLELAYDPNLLSAVHALTGERWQPGTCALAGVGDAYQDSAFIPVAGRDDWTAAGALSGGSREVWQSALSQQGAGRETWQDAARLAGRLPDQWQASVRAEGAGRETWQDARAERSLTMAVYQIPARIEHAGRAAWQDGAPLSAIYRETVRAGERLLAVTIEVWQPAGDPGHAHNPPKDPIPLPQITPWGTALKIACPLPGTALRIGRVPCILIAEREVAVRRSYMTVNSASLVRWPDLTPLPCTTMTIETDFESWCWSLSATLAGPDAWALVQPNPLACEVLATVNGQPWKFLLDVPSTNRAFNRDQVTLKGRSRSAWLHSPYTPSQNFSETNAREMVQLAEAALDNTGWTLDWQLPNWLVPAGRYNAWNTPIGALIRLAQATDDGLYTDPVLQVITAQPRWPVASWLLDGEVVDVLIPEAAIINLSQAPLYTQPLNGVYVSGESHGALALVKIAGTDGALQPSEPLVNELLCDTAGVAARQRGINALSDSGAGFTMDAETLFNPPTYPLVPPGQIVSIAGMKGVSRSVRISAQWSSGLQVKQSIGLERREVES